MDQELHLKREGASSSSDASTPSRKSLELSTSGELGAWGACGFRRSPAANANAARKLGTQSRTIDKIR